MITLDELYDIFCSAHRKKFDEMIAEHGAFNEDDCIRVGLTAVVHALEPVIAEAYFTGLIAGEETDTKADHRAHAAFIVKSILGDTTTREGVADCAARSQTVSISPASFCEDCPPVGHSTDRTRCDPCPRRVVPASFCEWKFDKADGQFLTYRTSCHSTLKIETALMKQFSNCLCGKTIKFMADASTSNDEGGSHSGEKLSVATHTSAATIDEDTLIEFVRDWDYSGYPYDLNFARKLKQKLLEVGYKILPREPTEEMLKAYYDAMNQPKKPTKRNPGDTMMNPNKFLNHNIKARVRWQAMWDAAK